MISNMNPRSAMILGIATTLAGAAALIVRKTNHGRKVRMLDAIRPVHRDVPIWAQAAAIVASSASALLLLVRQRA